MTYVSEVARKNRLVLSTACVVAAAVVFGGVVWLVVHPADQQDVHMANLVPLERLVRPTETVSRPQLPPLGAAAVSVPDAVPSFDVVRVTPRGDAVVAGRAEPNAQVALRENGREIGRTQADALGQWVIVPAARLAPGGQELSLTSRNLGGVEMKGDAPVIVLVPELRQRNDTAVAGPATAQVLVTPLAAAPRLLQPVGGARLSLDVVDYDDKGEIRFAGVAPPGAALRVYVDNKPVGEAVADETGKWSLQPGSLLQSGDHNLRVDQLGQAGRIASRVELPFQRTNVAAADLRAGQVVVQPRQNLWRLARQAYGQGVRYTIIYEANRGQIRDPNRIYPGQVIAVPKLLGSQDAARQAEPSTPSPSSSNRSR